MRYRFSLGAYRTPTGGQRHTRGLRGGFFRVRSGGTIACTGQLAREEPRPALYFRFATSRHPRWFSRFLVCHPLDRFTDRRTDRDRTIMPFYNRGRNRLTDRSVVGVQVLGGHELRHQGALADRGGAQHQDAIRRWTLRRAALPRARQWTRRWIPCRSWIRGGQVLRAAPNRRETRRV